MKSIIAGLRQLVIPWGAGPTADRIEIGQALPADLVAFYAAFSIPLIGGMVMYQPPDEYTYIVLGREATGVRLLFGGRNASNGVSNTFTIFPASLSPPSFMQFGRYFTDAIVDFINGSGLRISQGPFSIGGVGATLTVLEDTLSNLFGNINIGSGGVTTSVQVDGSAGTTWDHGGLINIYNGDNVLTYTPTWNNLGAGTMTVNDGRYIRIGRWCWVQIYAVMGVAGSGGSVITVTGPLPVDRGMRQTLHFAAEATNMSGYAVALTGGGGTLFERIRTPTANLTGVQLLAGMLISITGWYLTT